MTQDSYQPEPDEVDPAAQADDGKDPPSDGFTDDDLDDDLDTND